MEVLFCANFLSTCTCFFSDQCTQVFVAWLLRSTKMAACLQTQFFGFFRAFLVFLRCKKLQNILKSNKCCFNTGILTIWG